jgi:thioredoxin 1
MSDVKNITSENVDELSTGIVLVDFWASWCGPCKTILPVIDEVDKLVKGSDTLNFVNVCKVDCDTMREVANDFNVTSLPTILLLDNGEVIKRIPVSNKPMSYIDELMDYVTSKIS